MEPDGKPPQQRGGSRRASSDVPPDVLRAAAKAFSHRAHATSELARLIDHSAAEAELDDLGRRRIIEHLWWWAPGVVVHVRLERRHGVRALALLGTVQGAEILAPPVVCTPRVEISAGTYAGGSTFVTMVPPGPARVELVVVGPSGPRLLHCDWVTM